MTMISILAVPCFATSVAAYSAVQFGGGGFRGGPSAVAARTRTASSIRSPTFLEAAAGGGSSSPDGRGAGRIARPLQPQHEEEESSISIPYSIPALDEAAFLDSMSRDLGDVQDLADEYDALDEPAAAASSSSSPPRNLFAGPDEAAAARVHHASSPDIYESAAARCREIAKQSAEETTAIAEEEERGAAAEGKPVVTLRHFGGNALNGFAFLSLAASAAGLAAAAATGPIFDLSLVGNPLVDFGDVVPAIDLSSVDFNLDLPSVDVDGLLRNGIENVAEGTNQAVAAAISTLGSVVDAAKSDLAEAQTRAADLLSDAAEAVAAQVAAVASAVPSHLEAAREAAVVAAADLRREAAAVQSTTLADVATQIEYAKAQAATFHSAAESAGDVVLAQVDAARAGAHEIQDALLAQADAARAGAQDTQGALLAQVDAARAGAHDIQDSFAGQARDLTAAFPKPPSPPSMTFRVEAPDWPSVFKRASETEDAMVASFNRQLQDAKLSLAEAKSSIADAARVIRAWAEEEGRGSALALNRAPPPIGGAAPRDVVAASIELGTTTTTPAAVPPELELLTFQAPPPPGAISAPPSTSVLLPDWIDESTVELARTVMGMN